MTITVDPKDKNFLTEAEAKALLKAARDSRYGMRDHLLLLRMYRHGLRVSEAIDILIELKTLNLIPNKSN